jgi:hypothetical protein
VARRGRKEGKGKEERWIRSDRLDVGCGMYGLWVGRGWPFRLRADMAVGRVGRWRGGKFRLFFLSLARLLATFSHGFFFTFFDESV